MSDFEDQILRDRLQRLGGRMPDDDVAYAALQQRVRVAKRRRAAVASSGLAVVCVLALVIANLPGRNHQSVTTATHGVTVPDDTAYLGTSTSSTTTSTSVTSTSVATSTVTTSTAPTVPSSVDRAGDVPDRTAPAQTAPAQTVPGQSAPGQTAPDQTAPDHNGSTHTSSPAPTAPPAPSVPETEPEDSADSVPGPPSSNTETRTFNAAHGSITVRLANGQLRLLDHHADDSYTFQLDRSDPDRIRVRFRGDHETSQIDVSINDDHIVGTIEEQSDGSGHT